MEPIVRIGSQAQHTADQADTRRRPGDSVNDFRPKWAIHHKRPVRKRPLWPRRFSMPRGQVKWFDPKKGYGFIFGPEGQDVFVHYSHILAEGFKALKDGEWVDYELIQGDKGWQARAVHQAEPGPPADQRPARPAPPPPQAQPPRSEHGGYSRAQSPPRSSGYERGPSVPPPGDDDM
jgi:CspA family cold shock protein